MNEVFRNTQKNTQKNLIDYIRLGVHVFF